MLESSKQIKKNNILYNKVDLSLSSCVHVSMEKGTFCATYRRIRPLAIFGVTRLPIFFFVLRCKYMYRIELQTIVWTVILDLIMRQQPCGPSLSIFLPKAENPNTGDLKLLLLQSSFPFTSNITLNNSVKPSSSSTITTNSSSMELQIYLLDFTPLFNIYTSLENVSLILFPF